MIRVIVVVIIFYFFNIKIIIIIITELLIFFRDLIGQYEVKIEHNRLYMYLLLLLVIYSICVK